MIFGRDPIVNPNNIFSGLAKYLDHVLLIVVAFSIFVNFLH